MSKKGLSVVSGSSDVKHKMLNDGDAVLGITNATSTVSGTLNVLSETSGNLATRINNTSGSFSGDATTSLATSSSLSGEIDNTSVAQVNDTSRSHQQAAGVYISGSSLTSSDIAIDNQLSASRDDITLVTADASTQGSVAYAIDQYLKGTGLQGALDTIEALSSSIEVANLSSSVSSALETMRIEITGATATTETLKDIDDSIDDHISGALTGALAQDNALIGIVNNASASIGLDENAGARTLSYSGTNYIDSDNNLADAADTLEAQQVTNSGTLAGLTGTLATSAQLTVAGDASLTGDVSVTSSFQVPHYSSIPAELLDQNGALIANMIPYEGDIFYLTTADTVAPFTMGGKFYFCENGKWHRSPFFSDLDGDGTQDQLDSLPTIPNGTLSSTSGGTLTVQPGGESITLQQGTTVLDSSGSAYTGDLTLEVREATDSNVTNYAVLSQGGAVSSVIVFGPTGTTFSPALSVTVPLASVPADPNDLAIAYDDGSGWSQTVSVSAGTLTYDPVTNSVTFEVSSFSSVGAINKFEAAQSITFSEEPAPFSYTGLYVQELTEYYSEGMIGVSSSLGQTMYNGDGQLFGGDPGQWGNTGAAPSAEVALPHSFVEGVEYTVFYQDSYGDGAMAFILKDNDGNTALETITFEGAGGTFTLKWENSKLLLNGQATPLVVYNKGTERWEAWDSDGDGVADLSDAFPNDPTESADTDLDGTGNNADTDDDADGVLDGADPAPLDPETRFAPAYPDAPIRLQILQNSPVYQIDISLESEATDGFVQYADHSMASDTTYDDSEYFHIMGPNSPGLQNPQHYPSTAQEFANFTPTGHEWSLPQETTSFLWFDLPNDGTVHNLIAKSTSGFAEGSYLRTGMYPDGTWSTTWGRIELYSLTDNGFGVAIQMKMTNGALEYRTAPLDVSQTLPTAWGLWSGDIDGDGIPDTSDPDIIVPTTVWALPTDGMIITDGDSMYPLPYISYERQGADPEPVATGTTFTISGSVLDSGGNDHSADFSIDNQAGLLIFSGDPADQDTYAITIEATCPSEGSSPDPSFKKMINISTAQLVTLELISIDDDGDGWTGNLNFYIIDVNFNQVSNITVTNQDLDSSGATGVPEENNHTIVLNDEGSIYWHESSLMDLKYKFDYDSWDSSHNDAKVRGYYDNGDGTYIDIFTGATISDLNALFTRDYYTSGRIYPAVDTNTAPVLDVSAGVTATNLTDSSLNSANFVNAVPSYVVDPSITALARPGETVEFDLSGITASDVDGDTVTITKVLRAPDGTNLHYFANDVESVYINPTWQVFSGADMDLDYDGGTVLVVGFTADDGNQEVSPNSTHYRAVDSVKVFTNSSFDYFDKSYGVTAESFNPAGASSYFFDDLYALSADLDQAVTINRPDILPTTLPAAYPYRLVFDIYKDSGASQTMDINDFSVQLGTHTFGEVNGTPNMTAELLAVPNFDGDGNGNNKEAILVLNFQDAKQMIEWPNAATGSNPGPDYDSFVVELVNNSNPGVTDQYVARMTVDVDWDSDAYVNHNDPAGAPTYGLFTGDLNRTFTADGADIATIVAETGSTVLTFEQPDDFNYGYNFISIKTVGNTEGISTFDGYSRFSPDLLLAGYHDGGPWSPSFPRSATATLSHATASNGAAMPVIVTLTHYYSPYHGFSTSNSVSFTDSGGSHTVDLNFTSGDSKIMKIEKSPVDGLVTVYEDNLVGGFTQIYPPNDQPIITLLGQQVVDVEVGDTYTDAGATASDTEDGDITANIVTGGTFANTNVTGTFNVTYDVDDSSGQAAQTVARVVNVTLPFYDSYLVPSMGVAFSTGSAGTSSDEIFPVGQGGLVSVAIADAEDTNHKFVLDPSKISYSDAVGTTNSMKIYLLAPMSSWPSANGNPIPQYIDATGSITANMTNLSGASAFVFDPYYGGVNHNIDYGEQHELIVDLEDSIGQIIRYGSADIEFFAENVIGASMEFRPWGPDQDGFTKVIRHTSHSSFVYQANAGDLVFQPAAPYGDVILGARAEPRQGFYAAVWGDTVLLDSVSAAQWKDSSFNLVDVGQFADIDFGSGSFDGTPGVNQYVRIEDVNGSSLFGQMISASYYSANFAGAFGVQLDTSNVSQPAESPGYSDYTISAFPFAENNQHTLSVPAGYSSAQIVPQGNEPSHTLDMGFLRIYRDIESFNEHYDADEDGAVNYSYNTGTLPVDSNDQQGLTLRFDEDAAQQISSSSGHVGIDQMYSLGNWDFHKAEIGDTLTVPGDVFTIEDNKASALFSFTGDPSIATDNSQQFVLSGSTKEITFIASTGSSYDWSTSTGYIDFSGVTTQGHALQKLAEAMGNFAQQDWETSPGYWEVQADATELLFLSKRSGTEGNSFTISSSLDSSSVSSTTLSGGGPATDFHDSSTTLEIRLSQFDGASSTYTYSTVEGSSWNVTSGSFDDVTITIPNNFVQTGLADADRVEEFLQGGGHALGKAEFEVRITNQFGVSTGWQTHHQWAQNATPYLFVSEDPTVWNYLQTINNNSNNEITEFSILNGNIVEILDANGATRHSGSSAQITNFVGNSLVNNTSFWDDSGLSPGKNRLVVEGDTIRVDNSSNQMSVTISGSDYGPTTLSGLTASINMAYVYDSAANTSANPVGPGFTGVSPDPFYYFVTLTGSNPVDITVPSFLSTDSNGYSFGNDDPTLRIVWYSQTLSSSVLLGSLGTQRLLYRTTDSTNNTNQVTNKNIITFNFTKTESDYDDYDGDN